MYPFVETTDYLQLESHRTCEDEGNNYINVREDWYNLDNITKENVFVSPNTGSTVVGNWLIDGGDYSLEAANRERRFYCRKGKASFSITGISITLRLYVNPLYGKADVFVDGSRPSWIYGVVNPVDYASCNSYDHVDRTWGQEYIDVCLGTAFSDTEHTVELYCENEEVGVGGWFCIAGYKCSEFANKTGERPCYIMDDRSSVNREELAFANRANVTGYSESVIDISIVFGSLFVSQDGTPMGTKNIPDVWTGEVGILEFWPDMQGDESEQTFDDTFEITASYEDTDGVITKDWGEFGVVADDEDEDPDYYLWGDWVWNHELYCLTAISADAYIEIEFFGTWVKIYYVQLYNPYSGSLDIFIDGTYEENLDCYRYSSSGYRIHTHTVTGLDNVPHIIRIKNAEAGMFGDWHAVEWEEIRTYTEVVETITYNFPAVHVPPFAPENPRFTRDGDKNPTCDPVNLGEYDPSIPRTNANVVGLWVEKRPATFALCYQSGFESIMSEYDIVIVEPKALTRTIVKAYQDKGIKVFCYQSYGEEVGTYSNIWDSGSSLEPFTGDGNGVGGFASYYTKGGNLFGEKSECEHDRRRLYETIECAKDQTANYAIWAGRCSNACTKDWRLGYDTWKLGWSCGGGHNSSGHWQRDVREACSNSSCPDYNPVHGGCPFYESAVDSVWGQDYSIFTQDWPDENGTWGSFFIDVTSPAWDERVEKHYLKTIFNEGEVITETVTTSTYQTEGVEGNVKGFRISQYPIDADEPVTVTDSNAGIVYEKGRDFYFDSETGVFKFSTGTAAIVPVWGTALEVIYTRKGLQADGVFLDTIDTVDVFPSEEYKDAMVAMIARHKHLYPNKEFVMNRGFTILERLMPFTNFVMFETFVTNYNWDTETYYEITDAAEVAYNQSLIDQLFELRGVYEFNVLGLNYCGKDDDALKQLIAEKTRELGWMSWNSEISLNDPQHNESIFTKDLYIESNQWRLTNELPLP